MNYRLFLIGQLISLLGTWTRSIAQGWLVLRLTGSPAWLGAIAACQQLPVVAFASLGGTLADRYRRRSILVATQSASMLLSLALGALVLRGDIRVEHVVALAVLGGVVAAIDMPTRQAFVVELVGRDRLARAIATNAAMAMAAASLGPVLAGYGVEALGEGWCFVIDGASFAAVIAALLAMRGLPVAQATTRGRIADGLRFVRGEPRLRALLALLAITAFAGLPYATLFPALATDARALGWMSAASGLGALLGTPFTRRVSPAVACALLGALLVAFATTGAIALLVPLGAATLIQVSATNARVQLAVPDALRGRVMAVWAMILMGAAPLGALLAGLLDPHVALAIGGAICALTGTAAALRGTDRESRRGTRETPR